LLFAFVIVFFFFLSLEINKYINELDNESIPFFGLFYRIGR